MKNKIYILFFILLFAALYRKPQEDKSENVIRKSERRAERLKIHGKKPPWRNKKFQQQLKNKYEL